MHEICLSVKFPFQNFNMLEMRTDIGFFKMGQFHVISENRHRGCTISSVSEINASAAAELAL